MLHGMNLNLTIKEIRTTLDSRNCLVFRFHKTLDRRIKIFYSIIITPIQFGMKITTFYDISNYLDLKKNCKL